MKRLAVVLIITGSLVGLHADDADAAGRAANGKYSAIDRVDDSNLVVKIRNNRVSLYDGAGTVCDDAGLGFVPARHRGTPVDLNPLTVEVTGDVECLTRGGWVAVLPDFTLTYTYDPSTGELTDQTGQIFTRS